MQWMISPAAVPSPVNQILVQAGPTTDDPSRTDLYYVHFGHVTPPVLPELDTPEQAQDFVNEMTLPVVVSGSFAITRDRLIQINRVITEALAKGSG